MHLRLCALTAWVLAGSAQAQGAPDGCAGLASDSFEAAVLNCEAERPSVPPSVIDVIGEAPAPGVPLPHGLAQVAGDEPAPVTGPTLQGRLRVVQGPFDPAVLPPAVVALAASADRDATVVQVPVAQRPPAGLCRVWFPGRHAGLQRSPTACDVEVPEGAVLIRG